MSEAWPCASDRKHENMARVHSSTSPKQRIPALLTDREGFLRRTADRLGTIPLSFPGREAPPGREDKEAGVLLALCFLPVGDPAEPQWCFRLIKRASRTVQGGDIGAPGGMLHVRLDRLLRLLVAGPWSPVCRGPACRLARRRGAAAWRTVTLFLANALRESWEEIGLSPWDVRFLGALPPQRLVLFQRIIYPVCGWIRRPRPPRLNREVARVVDVPVRFFYDPARFGRLRLEASDTRPRPAFYPCVVLPTKGQADLLWGATFRIVTAFLRAVLDYNPPDLRDVPLFRKTIDPSYLTGRKT